ncbi:hypothetical protein [Clostridium novyi]|uniref:hypothetical protein n=1 Tax=Clostridium novyi TaxID=1542 RepID=UPI0009B87AA6|nr:hypothetical protein [Clostridium novyi]
MYFKRKYIIHKFIFKGLHEVTTIEVTIVKTVVSVGEDIAKVVSSVGFSVISLKATIGDPTRG